MDTEGFVYVADRDSNRELALPAARPCGWCSATPTWMPTGVAVDSKGSVYIADAGFNPADSGHNRVLKLAKDKACTASAPRLSCSRASAARGLWRWTPPATSSTSPTRATTRC